MIGDSLGILINPWSIENRNRIKALSPRCSIVSLTMLSFERATSVVSSKVSTRGPLSCLSVPQVPVIAGMSYLAFRKKARAMLIQSLIVIASQFFADISRPTRDIIQRDDIDRPAHPHPLPA